MDKHLMFDEAKHEYRWHGKIVPSVTQILAPLEKSFGHIDPDVLEAARSFGVHVHRAIELFNLRELDEDSLDAALVPYLAQWKAFLRNTGFQVTHGEERVYNPRLRYAGTLDIRGIMRNVTWLIDLKSGAVPKTCPLQTCGYWLAIEGVRPRKRAALQLSAERYNLIVHEDPADVSYWQSAVNLHHWRERHL